MASIGLGWSEFKTYLASIDPGIGRPDRPRACPICDGSVVWFDGWRHVSSTLLADGKLHRFDDWLWLQRAVCAACDRRWIVVPVSEPVRRARCRRGG